MRVNGTHSSLLSPFLPIFVDLFLALFLASASFSSPDNLPTFLKTINLSSLGGARSQEQITFLSGLLLPVNHPQILIGKTWLYKCCPPLICMGALAFFFLVDLLFYYKIILVVKSSNRDVYKKMISPTLCLWSSVNDLWILHSHTYQHIKHAFGVVVMLLSYLPHDDHEK